MVSQHQHWIHQQWRNILFSDGSRFFLAIKDGRVRVWRRIRERYSDVGIIQCNRWDGPSLSWYGANSLSNTGRHLSLWILAAVLVSWVTAQRCIDAVLRCMTVPFMMAYPGMMLQQDNARSNTARNPLSSSDWKMSMWCRDHWLQPARTYLEPDWTQIQRTITATG